MRKVKIITDSCSDLGAKLLEKYDIDYAKMSTVYNGEETPALITWSAEEAHALYDMMREGKRITTAQVTVEEFTRIFKKYLDLNYDIVYIGCSSKQSGSVNTGFVTAKRILADYPEAKIFCVDSLNASIGVGMLAIEAAKLAYEGATAEEINDYLCTVRKKVNQYVTVHSLDYLRRAGRVSGASAFFGNLIGVKPILISDVNGTQIAYKKVKGRNAAIKECVALMKESIVNAENQTVYLWSADCDSDEIEQLKELIKSEIPCKDVEVGIIGPIIGASIGPGALGIWCFGKDVTYKAE